MPDSFIKKSKSPNIFFGWWTVLSSGIIALLGVGFVNNGFSVLFKPIASELELSRAVTSMAASLQTLGRGFGALAAGWASDKHGPKRIILFGIACLTLGCIIMYFTKSLWAFLMVWGLLMGVGLAFGCDIPTDKAIVNWFVNKRGSALGIKFTIEALSGVVILPIIAWLLTNQGWRLTSVIAGLAIAIVGFSLTFLFIKDHRAEFYGLLPDGAIRKEEAEKPKNTLNQSLSHPDKSGEVEYTLKQTMKTSPYWLIVSVGCLSGLATPMMRVHCVPFLTDIGYSPVEAAAMMGILISSSIPARFAIGFIIDRMKTNHLRFILVGGYLLQALGIFAFLSHKTTAMIYVWFILTGLGQGISFGVTLPMIARYYGRKAYGSIDGIRMMMITPTALVAPVYCGWVYDTTNSYMSLFGLFAGLLVISGIIAIFILPPKSTVQLTNFHTN